MKPGLTVIIPVLDEEEIIEVNTGRIVEYLRVFGRPFEVLIVSNGSVDRTDEIGRRLEATHGEVRFFTLPKRGVGLAFSLAAREARFDRLVSVDMDLSIDLGFIPTAIRLLDGHEIVVGSKKMGSQRRTIIRKAGSGAFVLIARLLLGLSFEDYSIAAKAYRRDVILKNLDRVDYGTSYVLDIIFHTIALGGRAVEVPVHCEDYRASKFNLINEAVYRFRHLFRLWWDYRLRGPFRDG